MRGLSRIALGVLILVGGCAADPKPANPATRPAGDGPPLRPEVAEVDADDVARPPAGWESPYKSFNDVRRDRTPATTLDDALALIAGRPDWKEYPPVSLGYLPRHPAEKYLDGMTIVLDPGHGGDAHRTNWKRGPTGVREAEANLRSALLLRELLATASVEVHLTRDRDNDLSLADRARLANDLDADFFISLHHNAAENPEVNYTSVWLHGDYSDNGPALDLARYVALAMSRHLRTDPAYTSPLMSDKQMFQGGFGVLRAAEVPAILIEASFHTNPAEEQRLATGEHSLREAYAVYEALCEYALGGRPTQTVEIDGNRLTATLSTGLPKWWGDERRGPLPETTAVLVNEERINSTYDPESRRLATTLPANATEVEIVHENIFGHRNWPRQYDLTSDGSATTRPNTRQATVNVEQPWTDLPTNEPPFLMNDGGDTAAQAIIDALDLPAGSAITIARVDPAGGTLYALRYNDTGDLGFYPASTVKLATALMTLRQVNELDADVPFDQWRVQLEGDELTTEPQPLAKLLRDMIADSSNEAFNTLQEIAGFDVTHQYLQSLGVEKLLIRRHFTRPHWNHSRDAVLIAGDKRFELGARPAVDIPLNADTANPTSGNGESNWASTDDLVRLVAATFLTDNRKLPGFDILADALRQTNEPFVGRGLRELGDFVVYEKPGWWPDDEANVSAAYVYDARLDRHYFVGVHYKGTLEAAQTGIAEAMKTLFGAVRDGRLRL